MEKLSNDDLIFEVIIKYCGIYYSAYIPAAQKITMVKDYNKHRAELLSRLNRVVELEKQVAELTEDLRDCFVTAGIVADDLKKQVASLNKRLQEEVSSRPLWARGFSDDSIAAQVTIAAHKQLLDIVGAANQTEAVAKITSLKKQVEDLKCCGNCANINKNACPICRGDFENPNPSAYRKCWQPDNLTRKEREG